MQPTIEYLERAPAQANLTIDSPDALIISVPLDFLDSKLRELSGRNLVEASDISDFLLDLRGLLSAARTELCSNT